MIITKYLIKEILKSTLGVLLVLLLVGISNEFVVQLAKAASGELPAGIVLKILETALPSLLGTLLPLGFFLGIVLAYGRLFAESEMVVIFACGYSWPQLLRITLVPAAALAVLSAIIQLYWGPHALARQEKLLQHAQSDLISYAVVPGKFQKTTDGHTIFFAEKVSADKKVASQVFIAQLPQETVDQVAPWRVTTGQSAFHWTDPDTRQDYVVIQDGMRYQGNPGEKKFAITAFKQYGLHIDNKQALPQFSLQATSSWDLLRENTLDTRTEWQWRLTFPLSLLVVVFLAVPLSIVRPRQGKFSHLFPAVVTVIVYINALMISGSWLREGFLPEAFGFWWVHVIALTVGFIMLKRRAL